MNSATELLSYKHAIDQFVLVSVTDKAGRILEINDRFLSASKYTRAELLGQKHSIMNSGKHSKAFFEDLWKTISKGEIWTGEICNRAKDGTFFWVNTAIVPHLNETGQIINYISVRIDTTERKKYETELLQARLAAHAANRVKSRFLTNMSHEIRTPMNSIIGMAHLLKRTNLNMKQNGYISNILVSSERLLTMIDNIIDQSGLKEIQNAAEIELVNIPQLVNNVINKFTSILNKKGIALVQKLELNSSLSLYGNAQRLGQLLYNLVSNAVKFTDRGKIIIRVSMLQNNETDCLLSFEVEDTGIGIDASQLHMLFQPFNQVDASNSRSFEGAGLGLAISKTLVEMMGGEIGVKSKLGAGSCFWFTVRLSSVKEDINDENEDPYPYSLIEDVHHPFKGCIILVVDDNEINSQLVQEMLESGGAYVVVARNGKEAIDYLGQSEFDCILMDIQMPVMDGLEATRIIREKEEWTNIPVLAYTANADENSRALCMDAGMNDFIAKPVNPSLFFSTLTKWLAPNSARISVSEQPEKPELNGKIDERAHILTEASVLADQLGVKVEQIHKFTLMFIKSANLGIIELEDALEKQDMLAIAVIGHRLKSSSATIGAIQFSELCGILETCKDKEKFEKAIETVAQLKSVLKSIEDVANKNILKSTIVT
ncbi:MAG: response regulator [Burkholderiales bacterium]|nr:response regulator [Burkholderiales bacterium]MDR4518249.1 response regulator [Nitrosomonas sp.]